MFAGDDSPHSAAPHRPRSWDSRQVALSFVEPGPDRRVHLQPDHLDQEGESEVENGSPADIVVDRITQLSGLL